MDVDGAAFWDFSVEVIDDGAGCVSPEGAIEAERCSSFCASDEGHVIGEAPGMRMKCFRGGCGDEECEETGGDLLLVCAPDFLQECGFLSA